eukprot:s178_g29.t1
MQQVYNNEITVGPKLNTSLAEGMRAPTLNELRRFDRELEVTIFQHLSKGQGSLEDAVRYYIENDSDTLWRLFDPVVRTLHADQGVEAGSKDRGETWVEKSKAEEPDRPSLPVPHRSEQFPYGIPRMSKRSRRRLADYTEMADLSANRLPTGGINSEQVPPGRQVYPVSAQKAFYRNAAISSGRQPGHGKRIQLIPDGLEDPASHMHEALKLEHPFSAENALKADHAEVLEKMSLPAKVTLKERMKVLGDWIHLASSEQIKNPRAAFMERLGDL